MFNNIFINRLTIIYYLHYRYLNLRVLYIIIYNNNLLKLFNNIFKFKK